MVPTLFGLISIVIGLALLVRGTSLDLLRFMMFSTLFSGSAAIIMTALGGLGHALPYLIHDFWIATSVAAAVVLVELWAIAFIQQRYMQTPFWRAALQVVLGGALVFAAGILIGSA